MATEQALQRLWYLADCAALNNHCGQQLLKPDFLLEKQGIGNYYYRRYYAFLAPEDARISLAKYYFVAALKRADAFSKAPIESLVETDRFTFTDSLTPKTYSQLCHKLADIG